MLNSKELKKCLSLLSSVNNDCKDNFTKMKLLEIGYVLQQELENVSLIESMDHDVSSTRFITGNMQHEEVKRLLQDNIQLFNEKRKTLDQNLKLRNFIDDKLKIYEEKIDYLRAEIKRLNSTIDGMKSDSPPSGIRAVYM